VGGKGCFPVFMCVRFKSGVFKPQFRQYCVSLHRELGCLAKGARSSPMLFLKYDVPVK
jgi:hypothetical protein